MKIYHQLGHKSNWNKELYEERVGDGFILSPRHMGVSGIKKMNDLKKKSIFDPQFFLPSSPKVNLTGFNFFPQAITSGFKTELYGDYSQDSADRCVAYQIENDFEYIVIPCRWYETVTEETREYQEITFIKPFLNAIGQSNTSKKILVQIIVDKASMKQENLRYEILNWVTGFRKIDGVYLISDHKTNDKQIQDIDLLVSIMKFIDVINDNGMISVVGYCNTESILLSIANPHIITMGSFGTSKVFDIESFKEKESQKPINGPIPRLYSNLLIQNIDYRYINSIQSNGRDIDFFEKNKYYNIVIDENYPWDWRKPEPYKHIMSAMYNQFRIINRYDGIERFSQTCAIIRQALRYYQMLDRYITLDPRQQSGGEHLPLWDSAAKQFAVYKGWI